MRDRYEVLESIGQGGVSVIYRAYDSQLDREVAIKRLLPLEETQLNEPQAAGLEREIEALSRLRHPNVVSLYEFGEDDHGPYAVLELIEGQTLREVIREAAFSYDDFLEVARQLLEAKSAAEELGILHRDLKPGNVMITSLPSGELQVKVLDFGVAKIQQRPTLQTVDVSGAILGSADYIAPEQVEYRPIDHRADLYSIGCLLYYGVTQRRPFRGKTLTGTVENHLQHNVIPVRSFRPDLPEVVSAWLMKLLERNRDHRPASADEALEMLNQVSQPGFVPDADSAWLESATTRNSTVELGGHHAPPRIRDLLPTRKEGNEREPTSEKSREKPTCSDN